MLLLLAAVSADATAIPRRVRISDRRFVVAATGEAIVLQVVKTSPVTASPTAPAFAAAAGEVIIVLRLSCRGPTWW